MKENIKKVSLNIVIACIALITLFSLICNIKATEITDDMSVDKEETEQEIESNENFEGIFDTIYTDDVYKSSQKKNSYLPFLCFSSDRVIIDSKIENMGFIFANKSIEVNEEMKNLQVMFSSDSVRVNSNIERGTIIANGNITIDSQIQGNLLLISTDTITIGKDAYINGDLIVIANELNIEGTVNNSVLGTVTKCDITGNVNKDLRINVSDLNISSNENIKGNIYIETFSQTLNIKDNYPNAIVKVKEQTDNSAFSFQNILNMIITSLVLTLLYIVISKKSKGRLYLTIKDKVKNNVAFVILSGAILLLASFPVAFLLLWLSIVGLWVVTVPLMIIYIAFLVVVGMLDIFIVGSLMYKYIKEKYLKKDGVITDIIGAFVVYLVLYLLTNIPVVGVYISFALLLIAIGIVFTSISKKAK